MGRLKRQRGGANGAMVIDFYAIESLLTPEQRAVRDAVREFVDGEIIPNVRGWWDRHEFPTAIKDQFGALGLFGPNLPQESGCAGIDNIAYGLMNYELERGDSGLRSFGSVRGALVMADRSHSRSPYGLPPRPAEGRKEDDLCPGLDGEAQQRPRSTQRRAPGPGDSWRQRHYDGLSSYSPHA